MPSLIGTLGEQIELRRGKSLNIGSASAYSTRLANSLHNDGGVTRLSGPPDLSVISRTTTALNTDSYSNQSGSASAGAGFSKSPWAPTEDEVKGLASPGLKGFSSAARSIGGSVGSFMSDEMDKLGQTLHATDVNGMASSAAPFVSAFPVSRRLPPLMTSPNDLANLSRSELTSLNPNGVQTCRSIQGPASAAPFVRPIGHSHYAILESITEPQRMLSAGAASTDWTLLREKVVGKSDYSGAPGWSRSDIDRSDVQQQDRPMPVRIAPQLPIHHPSIPPQSFQLEHQLRPSDQLPSQLQLTPSTISPLPQAISHRNLSTFDTRPPGVSVLALR